MSAHAKLNEDSCPVSDDILGRLHQYPLPQAADIVKDIPESQRARLAAFCYNRRHLHKLGLFIASTCSAPALDAVAGSVGTIIYQQSRSIDLEGELNHMGLRTGTKPVSLAHRLDLDDD
ncbi:MAG: hypothetical protein ACR2PH_15570 [Desulfobulbia bacterium]